MTEDELLELEKILKNFYTPRELFGLTKRQQQIQRLNNFQIQNYKTQTLNYEVQSKPQKFHGLIRSDSLDSLIEIIQQDKLQSSILQSDEKTQHRQGILINSARKTESLGPDSQRNIFGVFQNSKNHNRQLSRNCQEEESKHHIVSKFEVKSPISQVSHLSRDRLGFGKCNDSYQNYCVTMESQTKGTPVDQTYLDNGQESVFVKERSFYMTKGDVSEEIKSSDGLSSPQGKGKKFNQTQRTIILDPEQKEIRSTEKNIEFDRGNSTLGNNQFKNTDMLLSTQAGTKISTKILPIQKIQNKTKQIYNTNDDFPGEHGCCFFFSSSKSKKKRRSTKQHQNTNSFIEPHVRSTLLLAYNKEEDFQVVCNDPLRQSVPEEVKSSIRSSGISSNKCLHHDPKNGNRKGKMCLECKRFEMQRQQTKEKMSDCTIF